MLSLGHVRPLFCFSYHKDLVSLFVLSCDLSFLEESEIIKK